MRVRIQLGSGPRVRQDRELKLRLAAAAAALLTPAAVMAGALALWGLAAEMKWTGEFPISSGPLARWFIWMAAAVALQLSSVALNRYARAHHDG
ncbi:MAG: hypothetical protein KIT09_01850 [Bryobacteraceae bacterium]|nr:hypothetical protein [Bryobacteraceae bacterium]